MKRKIQFRGYNLKNKQWLYGYYLVNRGKHFVVEDEFCTPDKTWEDFEVDLESVGQFVGEYEGEKIFEGDIVRTIETDGYRTVRIGKVVYDQYNCRFVVEVTEPYPMMIPITGEKQTEQIGMGAYCEFYYKYEVIGNVFSQD
jgi:uncharacterized phage protein (TIGR01671 family)